MVPGSIIVPFGEILQANSLLTNIQFLGSIIVLQLCMAEANAASYAFSEWCCSLSLLAKINNKHFFHI